MGSDEQSPREYVSELLQRIATLERERDEDRKRAHDLLNENLGLRGQLAALKALCGEALKALDFVCSKWHGGPAASKLFVHGVMVKLQEVKRLREEGS